MTVWLLALHICCTTLGLGGLVCANTLLAVTAGRVDAALFKRIVSFSLVLNRIFGGLLGAGILLGFATMGSAHVPATATWLVLAYVLVVSGIAFQAAVAIPWHLRVLGAADSVAQPARTARLIAAAFLLQFVLLVVDMVVKPTAG
jgi:hypothetical protein